MTDSEVPNRLPPFSLFGVCGPLLIAPVAIVALAAMAAPQNVFEVWPVTKRFAMLVVACFPWLSEFASSTVYPQAALLTTCLVVTLLPWTTAVIVAHSFANFEFLLSRQKLRRTVRWSSALFVTFVAAPLTLLCLRWAFGLPGDPSWARGFATVHRFGLAFLAVSFLYGGGMVLGGIPLLFRLLINLDLKKAS